MAALTPAGQDSIRHPHPELFQVIDPRPLLDDAAILAARFGGTGLLIAETLAAGLAHGSLWFGNPQNVGEHLDHAAGDGDVGAPPSG
jgi:hypothetical protein